MPAFASPEWFADIVTRAAAVAAPATHVVVEQRIVDAAVDDISAWHIVFGDAVYVVAGSAPNADITMTCDRATGAALAAGTTNAQHAISSGRLRISGDLASLAAALPALAQLANLATSADDE